MKKQKLIKVTASMDLPVGSVGTAVPAGYNGEMAIIFEGKDLGLYGFDGSSWSLIHRYQSGDNHYVHSGGMERYYVMSFTGQNEEAKLSFFTSNQISNSIPRISSTLEETKLQDINEVPPYTAGDQNKMLTVLSDGSLAWLLANQNYVVDENGNYGETIDVGTLEDSPSLSLFGGASISSGSISLNGTTAYATLSHSNDYSISSNKKISFFFKTSAITGGFGGSVILSKAISTSSPASFEGWTIRLTKGTDTGSNVTSYMTNNNWHQNGTIRIIGNKQTNPHSIDSSTFWRIPYNVEDNQWHKVEILFANIGSGLKPSTKVYLDGSIISEGVSSTSNGSAIVYPVGSGFLEHAYEIGNNTSSIPLSIGSYAGVSSFFSGQLKDITIENSIAVNFNRLNGLEANSFNTLYGSASLPSKGGLSLVTSSDYSIATSNYHNGATTQTISFWAKANILETVGTEENWSTILSTRNYAATNRANGIFFQISSDKFRAAGPTLSNTLLSVNRKFVKDVWYKFDLVWTSSALKVNINGVLIGSIAISGTVQGGQQNLHFGHNTVWPNANLSGGIIGVGIVNYEKSLNQMKDYWAWEQIYLPTPDSSHSLSRFESSTSNTFTSAVVTANDGLSLTTSNSSAVANSNLNIGTIDQTVSIWFKATSLNSVADNTDASWNANGSYLIGNRNYPATGRSNGFSILVASNAVRFTTPHGSNTITTLNNNFNLNQWYKIDLVWSSSWAKLYLNGSLVSNVVVSGTLEIGQKNMEFGRDVTSNNKQFLGNLLGVQFADYLESDAFIARRYSEDLAML